MARRLLPHRCTRFRDRTGRGSARKAWDSPPPPGASASRRRPEPPPPLCDQGRSEMNETRRGDDRHFAPLTPNDFRTTETLKPDPSAHAEILVLTYGLQTAGWIAETNLSTARRSDVPYWSRV